MTMRDKIAAIIDANLSEDYDGGVQAADAIIAALPVLVPDLEWEKTTGHWQASDRLGGRYEVFRLSGGRSTAHLLVRGYGIQIGDGSSMWSDIAAVEAHHRAAVCKMMGL